MKRMNGKVYRKFKGWSGRIYWVEVSPEELMAADIYRFTIIVTPLIMLLLFAWAAGIL